MADGKPTFYDVFIFYGRVDSKAFAIALGQRLKAMGFGVWIDQDDIPLGVDFQRQIDEAIAQTHNFVFVISPHCALEIERALQLNKRIIPVMH
ncbi:MAG TPA: toll/interleukin-1 receptor domain-containing protein, partial [Trichocoleus sp.]